MRMSSDIIIIYQLIVAMNKKCVDNFPANKILAAEVLLETKKTQKIILVSVSMRFHATVFSVPC